MAIATAQVVLDFWFDEAGPEAWYKKRSAFDAAVAARFGATHAAAAQGELGDWLDSADGALALCIVLDQFPRNMFRGSPEAFATDALALEMAARAIERGFDQQVPSLRRQFFYLPFMHSEALADQEHCVALCQAMTDDGADKTHKYAVAHRDIVARFGRFPHRTAVLGRESTEEEIAFLEQPGSSF